MESGRRRRFNNKNAAIVHTTQFIAAMISAVTGNDLIAAFSKILKNVPKDVFYEVFKDEHTVEQKIHDLLHMLLEKPRISLPEMFSRARSKIEIVVTFMAILELIRLKEILIIQTRVFGDIEVVRNKENIVPTQASDEKSEDNLEGGRPES